MEAPRQADYEGTVQKKLAVVQKGQKPYEPLRDSQGQPIKVRMWQNGKNGNSPDLRGSFTLPDGTRLYISLWDKRQ